MIKPELLNAILRGYRLHPFGLHGVGHWARVLENGVRVAEASGGDVDVVRHFAVLHDACRMYESFDPDHGARGAALAERLRARGLVDLSDSQFLQLLVACRLHTDERTHDDLTVRCCFDADRLDLGRVGVWPDVRYLGTDAAKSEEVRAWALERGQREVIPDFVGHVWEVEPNDWGWA